MSTPTGDPPLVAALRMTDGRHEDLVAQLLRRTGVHERRFRYRLSAALAGLVSAYQRDSPDDWTWEECRCHFAWEIGRDFGLRKPDAFRIDPETQTVTAWEVVVTSRLKNDKLDAYGELAFDLDGHDWTLDLVLVHHTGKEERLEIGTLAISNIYRRLSEPAPSHRGVA